MRSTTLFHRFSRTGVGHLVIWAGLTSIPNLALSALLPVNATPYDRQMRRVHSVLTAPGQPAPGQISLITVNQWMDRLRAIPYEFSPHWKTPGEVNSAASADCKGKALALYRIMRANGAKNLRLVIGKYRAEESGTHAWLEWTIIGGKYVLDPTFNDTAVMVPDPSSMAYVPLFAYEGERKYRAINTAFVTTNSIEHPVPSSNALAYKKPVVSTPQYYSVATSASPNSPTLIYRPTISVQTRSTGRARARHRPANSSRRHQSVHRHSHA